MVQLWEIVGGADKGGIIVRDGENTKSNQLDDRLSTGALVEEIALKGDRLNYKLVVGLGPQVGWVSIELKDKDLVVKTDKKPPPPPSTVGPKGLAPLPVALFFPGQGSQYVKMLEKVQDLPPVKDMLEKAKPILGYDILDLCLNGPEEKLEERPCSYVVPIKFLKENKTNPRTRMHCVYLCHARLSTSLVNDCGINSCQ